jgi:hypothetical protein
MKYLAFFAFLLVGTPLLALVLSRSAQLRNAVIPLLVFLTVKTVDINFVSMEFYRALPKALRSL